MVWLAATMVVALPAAAQVTGGATPTPAPTPAPTATASPLPVPPAPVIVLPTPTATPRPTPRSTETPRATPSSRSSASPTPRATPTSRASATPTPTPSPTASATPTPTVTVAPPPPPAPASPTPTPSPSATPAPAGGFLTAWPIAPVVGVVALLALGWVLLRRRWARAAGAEPLALPAPEPLPAPARARLAMTFRPIRAGLNLLSAISENEIVLANIGDAPAENIRLLTQLASAHTGQDADLAGIYAAPIHRPAVPAFALAPGEDRAITSIAALPRDAIRTLTAAGRPMFVPLVAVNILYTTGGTDAQLAQAFAVGVERVDSAKLAPFWLDVPPRTVDQVAARAHAAAVER